MAKPAPIYDLVLMLEPEAADDLRAKVLADVERMITASGEVVGDHDWGTRKLAFEIENHTDAPYRLVQFRGPVTLLEELNRTLRITDGLLRFRIVKVRPGTPEPEQTAHAEPEQAATAEAVAAEPVQAAEPVA